MNRKTNGRKAPKTEPQPPKPEVLHAQIAARAQELYEAGGCQEDQTLANWLAAENELEAGFQG